MLFYEVAPGWSAHGGVRPRTERGLDQLGNAPYPSLAAQDGGRINIASCSLGAARYCIDKCLDYINERKQFGSFLKEFQSIQFKIADMITDYNAARLMVHQAAKAIDNNEKDSTIKSAMAKKFATDACFNICNEALQIHGGYGYLSEYGIEKMVRDCRVHQILEGTNEIMRLIISRKTI